MSTWRMRKINRALAAACLGLLLLAVSSVCASAFEGIVTPKGAKRGTRAADAAKQSGSEESSENAGNAENTDGIAAARSREDGRTSPDAAQTGGGEGSASGSASRTATGTAILVGAGAYTFMRTKWKEQKEKSGKEPVYFVNHTREGAEEARNFAMENAGKTVAGEGAKL